MASANVTTGTDTDILIDATHGVQNAVTFLTTQRSASGIQISIISAMELLTGCRNKAELSTTISPKNRDFARKSRHLTDGLLADGVILPQPWTAYA